ncbi:MAG: sulfatase [Candidatus Eisenbacteria bacterium]|nr:sulfatase [Candidatus Eisenbacteria bacterium]
MREQGHRKERRGGTDHRRGAFAVFLLLLPALLSGCSRKPSTPPNVLLITIDTLRSDRVGAYGGASTRTPAIDRLAREGTLFTEAYSSIPITLPSHTSILTGLYPRTHGVLSHGFTLDDEHRTLAQILKENGYQTAAFVSSHVLDDKYGLARGFDIYWERYNYGLQRINALLSQEGQDVQVWALSDYIRDELKEPYFLWVHWFFPHKPYEPPPPMERLYDPDPSSDLRADVPTLERVWLGDLALNEPMIERFRSLYDGEVSFTDLQLDRVLDRLRERGVLDHTLVFFTADHGEVLYEHDRYFGHDIMLYDQSIRVPLIVRAPGTAPAGALSGTTVRNIDLAPTILDLLSIPPEKYPMEGRSFAPSLRGETQEEAPVFAEVYPPKQDWKSLPRHAVRYGGWKWITVDGEEGGLLYDMDADPAEQEDRSGRDPESLARMADMLNAWMIQEGGAATGFPELSEEEMERLRSLGYIGSGD